MRTALAPTAFPLSVGHLGFTPDGRFEIFQSLWSVYRAATTAPLDCRGYREGAEFVAFWSDYAPAGTLASAVASINLVINEEVAS